MLNKSSFHRPNLVLLKDSPNLEKFEIIAKQKLQKKTLDSFYDKYDCADYIKLVIKENKFDILLKKKKLQIIKG